MTQCYVSGEEKKAEEASSGSSSSCCGAVATPLMSSATKKTGRAAKLARSNVLSLEPYRCARDDYATGILLDANENAYGPASLPSSSLDPYDNGMLLERYPDPYQHPLKRLLCERRGFGIDESNVFVGVGSDEAIDLLMRIFCVPGGEEGIMATPPTYGMYKVCARVNDVQVRQVPLTPDFDLKVNEMISAATSETKLMFVCSPGNPTAKLIPLSDVRKLATSSYEGIVVVDEAYIDFSPSEASAVSLVNEFDNIVVLQTLSKAYGLAGIRCGFAIGPPDIIQLMNNVKAPYNVNKLTSDAAENALKLESQEVLNANVGQVIEQRGVLAEKLKQIPFVTKVYPSDANFLLFRVKEHANKIYKKMANDGVVSRFRGNELHCNECIRVTIGTKEQNEKFLEMFVKTYGDIVAESA